MAILKHTSLCTIVPSIPIIISRRIILVFKHVVTFGLVPIHGLGSSDGAVGRVVFAVTRDARLAEGLRTCLAGDFASETGHVHLFASAVRPMNPEPGADTPAIRTFLEAGGDLVVVLEIPDRVVVDGDDGKVFGLDGVDVGFVDDGDGGSGDVLAVVGVDDGGGLAGASGRVVGSTTVASVDLCERAASRGRMSWLTLGLPSTFR